MNDVDTKEKKQRTKLQNRALHKYFQLVADTLNEAGLDMKAVLKPEVDIPWSMETVKEYMWRPIQTIQLRKESTTELNTAEINLIFETMNRHLAGHGIHEPFPSIETLMSRME